MTARLFVNAQLVLADRVEPGWLRTDAGRITALGYGSPYPAGGAPIVDVGGAYLAPGLVDLHCHGGGGAAVYTGDPADVRTAAEAHLRRGTTAMLGSVATVDQPLMRAAARAVCEAARDPGVPNLVGVHFEGPFLAPARRGAQTESALRPPDRTLLEDLLELADGLPTVMTIAPELPGALDLIAAYSGDCVFAIGHTDATYDQVRAAADAGARHVTHLFNAMPPLGHRTPGPVAAALTDPRLTYELIADGQHVLPPVLALATGDGTRAVLVTDAMAAAGLGDGRYAFADRTVDVSGGTARLAGTDRLAGSTAFLTDCVRHLVRAARVPVHTALRMATANPADVLDLPGRGALEPGHRADLVILDAHLHPQTTYLA
ncbi:N-acetylglucosamine-6-phosphate deacetylase [Nonomuraea ceibae]|uniref:N-acetylglucosamine-6-phosphate deacetylase n=1 Tax=Nonomuraea ceibae TaxID=1935170 RepID=UPI001C603986|nr:N-acetylglucosamine-6-phosphate deacetylase [Nonomuraea ceibae]